MFLRKIIRVVVKQLWGEGERLTEREGEKLETQKKRVKERGDKKDKSESELDPFEERYEW